MISCSSVHHCTLLDLVLLLFVNWWATKSIFVMQLSSSGGCALCMFVVKFDVANPCSVIVSSQ